MKPLPLRTSLTLLYTGLLCAVVAVVAIGYHQLLVRQFDLDATRTLEDLVRGLHGYIRIDGGDVRFAHDDRDADAVAFIAEATRYYQVFDAASGQLLVQSRALGAFGVDYAPPEVMQFRERPGIHEVATERGRLRVSSSLVTAPSGRGYVLQVALPLDPTDRVIARLERTLWWAILIGLLGSAAVGRWMAGRALAPIATLAQATNAIDVHSLDQRLPVRGAGDELDTLTVGFNGALGRVDRAVGEMRQFSAALAHELRTPLAAIRGETELALADASAGGALRSRLEGQIEELDRLNGMIGQILTLARAEAGQIAITLAAVDLAAIARRTVEQIDVVADARQIALTLDADVPVVVAGDAQWLERLLLILLDNALKFTPPAGRVCVGVDRMGAMAHLRVTDSGQGIPVDALPHLFERFYRADPARSRATEGAGLGLALAKWIAERHHATLEVTSREGDGSTFVLRLPAIQLPGA